MLERWGRRFQVSPRNPFALLTYMGEDCAGAVQFVEPAARSQIRRFAGQPTIVVQRYGRAVAEGEGVVRLHQEDACQALGVTSLTRYENEGGPAAPDIVSLLLRESTDPASDVGTFVDSMILNWAILGTDAHAKNYSLMLESHSVRLAPLYDLLSALPYDREIPYRRAKLKFPPR